MKNLRPSSTSLTYIITAGLLAYSLVAQQLNAEGTSAQTGKFDFKSGFIENRGQFGTSSDNVRFAAYRGAVRLYFTPGGVTYFLTTSSKPDAPVREADGRPVSMDDAQRTYHGFRMEMNFIGAGNKVTVKGYGKSKAFSNFYLAGCRDGITRVPEYDRIVYHDLYPNIDLVFLQSSDVAQYEFIVHPGGDPGQIAMRCIGTEDVSLDRNGDFLLRTPIGGVRESSPLAYQQRASGSKTVASRFTYRDGIRRIDVGPYDHSSTLIIDPWITYFGGSGDDRMNGITTDTRGDILVAGESASVDFPVKKPGFQDSLRGGSDAIIARFTPDGARQYTTFIGGTLDDRGFAVAHGANREAILAGGSKSTNFPVTANTFATTNKGDDDIFVAKFDSLGMRVWATYYGGKASDRAYCVAVDSSRNIIVAGQTLSTDAPMPSNAFMKSAGGWDDGIILKLTSVGKRAWSTYYGGSGGERMTGIAVGEKDNIYFCGFTWSQNFPVKRAFRDTLAGTTHDLDPVIFKLDSSGRQVWSTYCGGGKEDVANGIALDKNRNVYVVGRGASTDFPTTANSFQPSRAAGTDAFIVSFDSACAMRWGTWMGGSLDDSALAVCVDPKNDVYFTGSTFSTNFPITTYAAQSNNRGGQDVIVAKFDTAGTRLWSTYYGGTGADCGRAVTADSNQAYVVGVTESSNLYTINPLQANRAYLTEGFIAMVSNSGVFPVELTAFSGRYDDGAAVLTWTTETETNNYGFEVERWSDSAWQVRGFVAGHVSSIVSNRYEYTDPFPTGVPSARYRLRQIDLDGGSSYSSVIEISNVPLAPSIRILDLYPNPLRETGNLSVYTPTDDSFEAGVYNTAGEKVLVIASVSRLGAGYHSFAFDGSALVSGIYFLHVGNGKQTLTQRLVITR